VSRCVTNNGHVERSTAQVIHHHRTFGLSQIGPAQFAFHPGVCQSGCRRFVDDVDDIQARDSTCVLSRLTSNVVEVIRNGDDSVRNRTDLSLSVLLELLHDERGDKFRRQLLTLVDNEVILVTHFAFDGFDHMRRVFHRNSLEGWPNHDLAIFAKQHH